MKETMDGAAKSRLDKVAQHILPERPHHLALSLGRKFPKPDGFWYTGASSPLQYLTFVSDADRGILITRPSYDICEDHESAVPPMPVKVLAKGEVKKKLSIKDYQKKKNSSASPTDNDPPVKSEARLNGAGHAKAPKEEDKKEGTKLVEKPEVKQEAQRPDKPRPELNGERSRVSQHKSQHDLETRKRNADTDNDLPPQKRVKSESITKAETSRSGKPETPRARDRLHEKAHRDEPQPKTNGLAPPVMDRDRENTASPRSTIQVNGTRPRSDSGKSTPRKPETSKATVPALLSPLHPSLVERLDELQTDRKKTGDKGPAKSQKVNGPPATRPKQSVQIPQLLSPTLPPIVEAELARLKKTPPKSEGSQSNQTPESPSSVRRKVIVQQSEEEEALRPLRRSRVVTIKLKKAMAKRAKELLSLPSRSAKEALKKERSISVEGTPPPARKRPRLLDDAPPETAVVKRNKTTADTVVARPTPSTPLKQSATAMSRVTSSQSQGTPGNSTGLTPGTLDRPPTRSDSVEPGRARAAGEILRDRAASDAFREKHEEYRVLGSSLKHQRDDILRSSTISIGEDRRASALHFEMVLAYMIAFYALNQARVVDRKVLDFQAWESLLPHMHELKRRVHTNRALRALALQMHALCLEQITLAFHTLDPAAAAQAFARWSKLERARVPMWSEVIAACDAVDDRRMKTLVGPWTKVEDAVAAALNIMKRWADREGVQWRPVIMKERDREKEKVNGAS